MTDLTPMMRQYQKIKSLRPDCILFFRMGDFYEMFSDDALIASKILNIALTTRDKSSSNPVPMCGIPYHALDSYLYKIVRQGYKVAICEQTEDPKKSKGLVSRDIVRVVSEGATLDVALLDERSNNYIASILVSGSGIGLSYADLSTGLFRGIEFGKDDISLLQDELSRLLPKEILLSSSIEKYKDHFKMICLLPKVRIEKLDAWQFSLETTSKRLLSHFGVTLLDGLGLSGKDNVVRAAGGLIGYLADGQKSSLRQMNKFDLIDSHGFEICLDTATISNLELLDEYLIPNSKEISLFSLMNETMTSMGSRFLKERILRPLKDCKKVRSRLEIVKSFHEKADLTDQIRERLAKIKDMERIITRIASSSFRPRDLIALSESIFHIPYLGSLLDNFEGEFFRYQKESWDNLSDIEELITASIVENPPFNLNDGGIIKDDYDKELKQLKTVQIDSRKAIMLLEIKAKQESHLPNLRVKYNKVYGYFFEVSNRYKDKVPQDWERKQSLVNSERFVSPALKDLEEKILNSKELSLEIELKILEDIRLKVVSNIERIQSMSRLIGKIDFYSAMSYLAIKRNYVIPSINDLKVIDIKNARHPLVELSMENDQFVPNNIYIDDLENRFGLITGPNMSGKSTYIRSVALIVLMAQVGSFVPASSAIIGVVDKIFTRVGAHDSIQQGKSTFMVEMSETANIINNMNDKALVILDEIGRGTSTFDGLAIAQAVTEKMAKDKVRGFFATHYHELIDLENKIEGVYNLSVSVIENEDDVIFTRKIVKGSIDKSYGIHVAKLAGMPRDLVSRSEEILLMIEKDLPVLNNRSVVNVKRKAYIPESISSIIKKLKIIDLDRLRPLDALNILSDIKQELDSLDKDL